MKTKIAFLSSMLVLGGATVAHASDCIGGACNIEKINYAYDVADAVYAPTYAAPTYAAPTYVAPMRLAPVAYTTPMQYTYSTQVPMRAVKTLSIKPVPEDTRPPIWDGTNGNYQPRPHDKTVDWRDGVPIWDESIVNYKYKDFSDWFLEQTPEIYVREVDTPSMPTGPVITPVYSGASVPMAPVMPMMSGPVYQPQTPSAVNPIDLFNQNMEDAAATRARVEELLNPIKPCSNLWTDDAVVADEVIVQEPVAPVAPVVASAPVMVAPACAPMAPRPQYVAQDMSGAIRAAFGRRDGCPFDSETECNIWLRKPIVRETVSPRSPQIQSASVDAIVSTVGCGKEISANDAIAAPLLDRYKMLMRSAQACCTEGMAYQLKRAGASEGLIYKFMSDDANFYGFGSRCLMMTDAELDEKYPNTSTAVVAADVRNACLCRGRQWFNAMLAPFQQVYAASPAFKEQKFNYTYTDGLQRQITVSVNNDVQNVLNQLSMCP